MCCAYKHGNMRFEVKLSHTWQRYKKSHSQIKGTEKETEMLLWALSKKEHKAEKFLYVCHYSFFNVTLLRVKETVFVANETSVTNST